MKYISTLTLPSLDSDNLISQSYYHVYQSVYPFRILSTRGLFQVDFDDITIITGGNGSGKSTLLNVIAQKLRLRRQTPFNDTDFFERYLAKCEIEKTREAMQLSVGIAQYGRIITSDEVFDYMIETRLKNDEINDRRKRMIEEIEEMKSEPLPRTINVEDSESVRNYARHWDAKHKSPSKYVKENLGFNLAENSNGENAFRFFTEAIRPYGLYLLDEPENSLSAERQIDLSEWIFSMARYERCQFIISTHSPFMMATPGAKLYNLDVHPARVMSWTEVASVKVYHDFFEKHAEDFR